MTGTITPEFTFETPKINSDQGLSAKDRQRLADFRSAVNDALEARAALIRVVRRLADNGRTMAAARKTWAGVRMLFSIVGKC